MIFYFIYESWLDKKTYNLEMIPDFYKAFNLFKLLDIRIDITWFNASIFDDWWWGIRPLKFALES